ncbi:MAG: hypothetical protein ACREIC_12870 [Limisphaerales bacterium]
MMIIGATRKTASTIAAELGIGSDDRAVAGPELEKMRELSKVITHEEVLSHIAKGSIGTNRADGET